MLVRALLLIAAAAALLHGQGETTSAIEGVVADPSGAALPAASVTLTSAETGWKREAITDDAGRFSFPQLKPGAYILKVETAGFAPRSSGPVLAALGQKQTVKFTLQLAVASGEITVNGEPPLINPDNPNTSTTLNAQRLQDLPNPGGDLTYPLQFAAGALINTAGSGNDFVGGTNGYGNVQFNGLPSLSNGYIVDGLETNDPLTNLNSGLSTNLVLGLNSISEVTVNTLSYTVDQGRYGASQVNYVTKAGTNRFHGNLYELWNGSRLNAADFFTNSTPGNRKPRSSVNHFGGSLGGPVIRDRLFFFFDSEWVRLALPIVSPVTAPTPAFQQYVLRQLPLGGSPELVPFYRNMFSLYGSTAGTPLAVLGCPLSSNGSAVAGPLPDGDGCANRQTVSHSSDDHEQVQTVRMDYNFNEANTTWYRFQYDGGLQAAYTDPINPLFNALSPQPLYSFASGYTHVFSPSLVNYFNPAFSWYESLFGPADFQKTLAAFPIVLQGSGAAAPFTTLGGLDNTWVQGRRASRFFLNDNLAWTHGAHELRFGTNTRILRLNDYNFGEGAVPLVNYTTLQQFISGVASTASKTFPLADSQPFRFLNLDLYAQDTWKLTPALTWTFGIRASDNSNPLNPHSAVARLAGSFAAIPHDVDQPLNASIRTGLGTIFAATPAAILQPRTALAWQAASKTVVRAGFGLFSDLLPGSVVDLVGVNPPYSTTFQGGLLGTVGGAAIAPGVSGSAIDTISVTHFTDPGCPFAYAASPALAVLRWRYGDQLDWRLVTIGLAEDPQRYIDAGYTPARSTIGQQSYFKRFGMPLLMEPRARVTATGRACRAIVATRLLDPPREDAVLRALQIGWFTTTLLLDQDDDIAQALARVDGLDVQAVIVAIDDERTVAAYEADKQETRQAEGGPTHFQGKARQTDGPVRYSAPSLVFHSSAGRRLEAGGFQRIEAYDVLIANLDPTLERQRRPRDRSRPCSASLMASSRRRSLRSSPTTTSSPTATPPSVRSSS